MFFSRVELFQLGEGFKSIFQKFAHSPLPRAFFNVSTLILNEHIRRNENEELRFTVRHFINRCSTFKAKFKAIVRSQDKTHPNQSILVALRKKLIRLEPPDWRTFSECSACVRSLRFCLPNRLLRPILWRLAIRVCRSHFLRRLDVFEHDSTVLRISKGFFEFTNQIG